MVYLRLFIMDQQSNYTIKSTHSVVGTEMANTQFNGWTSQKTARSTKSNSSGVTMIILLGIFGVTLNISTNGARTDYIHKFGKFCGYTQTCSRISMKVLFLRMNFGIDGISTLFGSIKCGPKPFL